MGRPIYASAVIAALLAVNIDLSLDPMAAMFWVWHWTPDYPQTFFGVTFDNFICWFIIVFSYSYLVRRGFRWFDCLQRTSERWWRFFRPLTTLAVPALAGGLSLVIVTCVNRELQALYKEPFLQSDAPVFVAVFAAACLIAVLHARPARRDLQPSWWVLALPMTYHLLSWALLLGTGRYRDPQYSALLIVIPFTAMVGFSAFGWTSRVRLATALTLQMVPAAPAAATPLAEGAPSAAPAPWPQT
jgi:hypothetical protein